MSGADDATQLRPATPADLDGMLEIYNEVVRSSTAIYDLEPAGFDARRAWYEARVAAGYPVLVAVDAQGVAGYASFGDFRAMAGFRYTVEHSVHVRADRRGRGLGGRLLAALLPIAAAMDKHVIIGAIDADNVASLRLHQGLGFEPVARFREIGHKFGGWRDVVFMQRFVDAAGAARD